MEKATKRIAVLYLHLPTGEVLPRQVLTIDTATAQVLHYAPLTHEEAFVEWHPITWHL